MAGSFISEGGSIPIMFVRHGQSTNNPIYEGLYAQQFAGDITAVREGIRSTTSTSLQRCGDHTLPVNSAVYSGSTLTRARVGAHPLF